MVCEISVSRVVWVGKKRSRAVAEHGEPAERTALGLSGSAVVERVQRRTVLTAVGFHTRTQIIKSINERNQAR